MQFAPYLTFDGRCEEAFAHYQRVFGGEIGMTVTYADMPSDGACMTLPPGWETKVAHTRLDVGGWRLMGSDSPCFQPSQGITVQVAPETVADAERIFAALAEGGTVTMPGQPTFWAAFFGMVVDRFGTPWMINCEHQGAAATAEAAEAAI